MLLIVYKGCVVDGFVREVRFLTEIGTENVSIGRRIDFLNKPVVDAITYYGPFIADGARFE